MMAHFAEINADGVVIRVLVVPDEHEHHGAEYLSVVLGLGGTWVQCSYNGRIRKNYPGPGFFFDADRDAFIPPQPFPSWHLDVATCRWVAPVPMPSIGGPYVWDEAGLDWVAMAPSP